MRKARDIFAGRSGEKSTPDLASSCNSGKGADVSLGRFGESFTGVIGPDRAASLRARRIEWQTDCL